MLLSILFAALMTYLVYQILQVYQLAFSSPWPIFPGPLFAAASPLYKVYIEVFLDIS